MNYTDLKKFNITTNLTIPCDVDGEHNYVVIGLYVPVTLIALVANILIITVVVKFHYMRNITNYFLVNLSIADLLVTIVCMPAGVWSAYTLTWKFGQYPCKLLNYMQCISVGSSVFTITAMALDRYIAINQPFAFGPATRRSTMMIIVLLWVVPMIVFAPLLSITDTETLDLPPVCAEEELVFCGEFWDKTGFLTKNVFGTVFFIIMFAVPSLIIFLAYAMMGKKLCSNRPPSDDNNSFSTQQNFRIIRERKRVAWILLLLVVIFAFCWMPYNTGRLFLDLEQAPWSRTYDQYTLLLGHMNSALNPIIYCVMSKNFRTSLRQLLCSPPIKYHNGRNRRLQVQWADSSGSLPRGCLQRMNTSPPIHVQLHMTLSRLQSSQKTTKTCAV